MSDHHISRSMIVLTEEQTQSVSGGAAPLVKIAAVAFGGGVAVGVTSEVVKEKASQLIDAAKSLLK